MGAILWIFGKNGEKLTIKQAIELKKKEKKNK